MQGGVVKQMSLFAHSILWFWKEEITLNKKFYTSGLGGVYPEDIKIGAAVNIEDISATRKDIEIKLLADPLESNLFGVLSDQ